MNKFSLTLFFFVVALTALFISCNKSEKITQDKPALIFKTDAERDANAVALVELISKDNDWKTLAKINAEFLDIVVKSNIPITSDLLNGNNPALQQLNSKEFQIKFDEAKRLAGRLRDRYFQNSEQCYTCATMTEAKWSLFTKRINTFRTNKVVYNQFLMKLGVSAKKKGNASPTELNAPPDCNNWRFSLCAGACVITAPTAIVFAACMAVCIAEYC